MIRTYPRRTILQAGGLGAVGLLAGCLDGGTDEATIYVVAYHWGFAGFDEEGTEHEVFEIDEGTEVTVVAVNDHAEDAFDNLPDSVAEQLEGFDALERTKEHVADGTIPEPDDHTIEEKYQEAHDHGHGDDDHGNGHGDDDHGNGLTMLDHEVIIPAFDVEMEVYSDAHEPSRASFQADETGNFEIVCTHDCGYGHAYMRHEMLAVH